MEKVSRNIKRLRIRSGLTQDALAGKLYVTRQTVSSWETDRTQPDIEMLGRLSEALGADIEELIYGKKRNVGLEADKGLRRRTLTIVLSVLGSLFTAVGLILLFAFFWEKFPESVKGIFGLLPLLAGMGFGLFVYFKKKASVIWREAGGIVWAAGIVATNALINSIYLTELGFTNILLIDAVLILPVMFILDAEAPLTIFTAMAVAFQAFYYEDGQSYAGIPVSLALLAASVLFIVRDCRSENQRPYTVWLAAAACAGELCVVMTIISGEFLSVILILMACLTGLLILDREKDFPYPFRYPAVVITAAAMTVYTVFTDANYYHIEKITGCIPSIAAAAAVMIVCAVVRRKTFFKNPLKLIYCAICVIFSTTAAVVTFTGEKTTIPFVLITCAAAAVILIRGITTAKLLTADLGILMFIAMLWLMIIALDFGLLGMGIAFAATGAVMLAVNKVMLKRFRAEQPAAEGDGHD